MVLQGSSQAVLSFSALLCSRWLFLDLTWTKQSRVVTVCRQCLEKESSRSGDRDEDYRSKYRFFYTCMHVFYFLIFLFQSDLTSVAPHSPQRSIFWRMKNKTPWCHKNSKQGVRQMTFRIIKLNSRCERVKARGKAKGFLPWDESSRRQQNGINVESEMDGKRSHKKK